MCVGGMLLHPLSPLAPPYFLSDSRGNLAKTTLHCSPSSSMVMLFLYLFAVCLSGHVAKPMEASIHMLNMELDLQSLLGLHVT
jgi:hypothetical protein